MSTVMNTVWLTKNGERRVRGGHLWIYSNEVDNKRSPLKQFAVGEQVLVQDAAGAVLGIAMMNPQHLICARMVSRDGAQLLDRDLLVNRIASALQWRDRIYRKPFYRLVYGDSDFLPGLVVDRYGDVLSVQCNSAGMAALQNDVLAALEAVCKPSGIVFRNDSLAREAEGLQASVEIHGDVPDWVMLEENGVVMEAPLKTGQKTGWFYDHRENRAYLQRLARGASVLDVFSYAGSWGVQALAAGARSLTAIDSSDLALEAVSRNAARYQMRGDEKLPVSCLQGQADDMMKHLANAGQVFDLVVLDPPAFIKRRKDHAAGFKAYHQHNQLALKLLAPGGVLVSASCSMSLTLDELVDVVGSAARRSSRFLQIVHTGGQGADHPVHPLIPETAYLKAVFVRDVA
ncbi:MAG TPA: class I SAM-dependent rRNA methyltransferase [Pseudomonadales bacterium]|nr:class I SAM-dependent rRNA methyltransferase [Pseudomonadales bacterium]